jgi:hypothetical protein
MNVAYSHLLLYEHTLEGILKLVLERLSLSDPPFMSKIKGGILTTRVGASIDLRNDLDTVEDFVRSEFGFRREAYQWKDIRKHNIRNALLYRYINKLDIPEDEKSTRLLKLHLSLLGKKPAEFSVKLDHTFNISDISFQS